MAVAVAVAAGAGAGAGAGADERIRFNRDIRPILSNHCFPCHGPDGNRRQGGLRLDDADQALWPADSGQAAIVPGRPEASGLIERIFSEDAAQQMPPAELDKALTAVQKELLRRWVAEGAEYERHWAYLAPQRPPLPPVDRVRWPRNAIDFFVLNRLEREGLSPSPAADPVRIFRRLALDLTGLPPVPGDVETFLSELAAAREAGVERHSADAKAATPQSAGNDRTEGVYEKWVDRFLASPHFGERMAIDWLDAARFADTNGYQVDRDREMYAWRDWVIEALNADKPFDEFTIEQLAGDLLPAPSLNQKIATGFHRNHMLNEEGGVIPEEFLAEYCADRVETTASVWLGQTFNCARCHDHKFDPFTQRDFYGLYAFFHNIAEQGIGNYGASIRRNAPPMLKLPAPELEAKLAGLRRELDEAKQKLANENPQSADKSEAEQRRKALEKQIDETEGQIPTTLVMAEAAAPRRTFILIRGAYDKPGSEVTAATPAVLPEMADGLPRSRLGLARWLVDPANPLPARVTMNRLWQSFFGVGLVRTAEDFGTQGEPPTHPELLDWLATEFVRSGWNVKAMVRLITTSATYRQGSGLTAELRERDPENRLWARGPRFRLPAEFVRDQALAASGLLVTRIGGPSVRPYHPPGLYEQVVAGSGASTYLEGQGDQLYRRSLYTYWKRSVPHPAMLVFDAPFRETCTLRRPRTNTPLQALNLMNDPTYVEAARCLAERMLHEGRESAERQLSFGFRSVVARRPSRRELAILMAGLERARQEFRGDPARAAALLQVGESPVAACADAAELAALTTVASTILNLDEAVTKE